MLQEKTIAEIEAALRLAASAGLAHLFVMTAKRIEIIAKATEDERASFLALYERLGAR